MLFPKASENTKFGVRRQRFFVWSDLDLRRRGELTQCKPSSRPEAQPQLLEPLAIRNSGAIGAQMQFRLQVER